MWTERDRRLAQVLLQAKAVSLDDLHRARALQDAAGGGKQASALALADALLQQGSIDLERLRALERSALAPHAPKDPDSTNPLARAAQARARKAPGSRIPKAFGGYEVLGPVASGASGTVYRARDPRRGELVALKVLSTVGAEKRGTERFVREAEVSCALRHENLVCGYHIGVQDGIHFLVMELVEGESAGARLRREGVLPEDEVVNIGRAICRALECARRHAVVHRDVKPDNILIDVEGNVKLCDLGLARPFGRPTHVTESGIAVGTPRYIAPEQARGDPRTDHRADVYALGITLFHLVTGQVPFDGDSGLDVITKHIYEEMPSIRTARPELSLELDAVIRRATRKKPSQRYETAGDMGRDLDVLATRLAAELRYAEAADTAAAQSPSPPAPPAAPAPASQPAAAGAAHEPARHPASPAQPPRAPSQPASAPAR